MYNLKLSCFFNFKNQSESEKILQEFEEDGTVVQTKKKTNYKRKKVDGMVGLGVPNSNFNKDPGQPYSFGTLLLI